MPSNSISTVVTSPPYWGLRNYGTQPVVWAGSEEPCEDGQHEWAASNGCKDLTQAVCVQCGSWLGELGHEPTPELYVDHLTRIFREVRRVLRPDGSLWLNLGDSFWGSKGRSNQAWSRVHPERDSLQKSHHILAGKGETRPQDGSHPIIKPKDLCGIPWRVALALQADGWYLRMDCI